MPAGLMSLLESAVRRLEVASHSSVRSMHTRGANEPTRVGRVETLAGNQLEDDKIYGCIVIRCRTNKLWVYL